MKKLISTCRAIQTVSAIVASIAIVLMSTAYEPSIKAFLIMGVVFLVAIILSAIMALIIDIAKEAEFKRQENLDQEDDELPMVEIKELNQQRSCRAFYNCKHGVGGFEVTR